MAQQTSPFLPMSAVGLAGAPVTAAAVSSGIYQTRGCSWFKSNPRHQWNLEGMDFNLCLLVFPLNLFKQLSGQSCTTGFAILFEDVVPDDFEGGFDQFRFDIFR